MPTPSATPRHVAIIMDGNGRWAGQRGLPRIEGHRRGVESVRRVVEAAGERQVEYLTLFAFSSENWGRPEEEVSGLMGLLEVYLRRELRSMRENGIRLHVAGDLSRFPDGPRRVLEDAVAETAQSSSRRHLVLALGYGSRQEIADAARRYALAALEGREDPAGCTWERLRPYLWTQDLPDPDLIIRTSGEKRTSNFLLLQGAYAEWVFSPVLWPDFGAADLDHCLAEYARRERRFGLTGEQARTPGLAPTTP